MEKKIKEKEEKKGRVDSTGRRFGDERIMREGEGKKSSRGRRREKRKNWHEGKVMQSAWRISRNFKN